MYQKFICYGPISIQIQILHDRIDNGQEFLYHHSQLFSVTKVSYMKGHALRHPNKIGWLSVNIDIFLMLLNAYVFKPIFPSLS